MDDPERDEDATYAFLSGAAGFAYRDDPSTGAGDDEPPTEELPLVTWPQPSPATYGGRERRSRAVAVLVAVAVVAGAGLLVAAAVAGGGEKPPVPPRAEGGPVFVPPDEPAFAAGTFELAGSVPELHLTLGRPGAGPIRVSAPPGDVQIPAATIEGTRVRLGAAPDSRRLDVLLDDRTQWTIRMTGGVRVATFELTGGSISEVDLSGGADSVFLALPRSGRALPVRMSGGVREWSIRTEGEVPVRVRAQSGAGEVTLYGRRQSGLARNTTLTAGDGSGLEVTAAAGFGSLAITSR
ncbi:MAG: hypothetical protein SYR96_21300 [Actinomycetota bacterium]|nr:hypothetical protein [Actinomycetota bacterium]